MGEDTSFLHKRTELPNWVLWAGVGLIVVLVLTGGGYSYSEYKNMKAAYKDSLEVRTKKVKLLELTIENANDFENREKSITKDLWRKYLREQKLRKNAEEELFIYHNYTRKYIDSFLSAYKYRGVK